MTDKILAASISGVTGIQAINVTQSHDAACAMGTISCISTSKDVGDAVQIYLGYSGGTTKVLDGYIKKREQTTPDGTITLTVHDVMTRAVDYFIVSNNPETGYTYRNITAHDLIQTVLEMAGLSSFDFDNTYFTFGISSDVEVNLVSSYDYSRMIADLIAWMVWSDKNGTIKLKNRKPYPMDGLSGQPGDVADVSVATLTDSDILDINDGENEKDLRNKIVIYGADNLYTEASSSTSYNPVTDTFEQILPVDYYKTTVLASPLIDSIAFAQDACDYNLARLNRVTWEVPITIEGNEDLEARQVLTLNSTEKSELNGDWYIYQLQHSLNKSGFITSMILRK